MREGVVVDEGVDVDVVGAWLGELVGALLGEEVAGDADDVVCIDEGVDGVPGGGFAGDDAGEGVTEGLDEEASEGV